MTLAIGIVSMTHSGCASLTLSLPHVLEASIKIFRLEAKPKALGKAPPHIMTSATGKCPSRAVRFNGRRTEEPVLGVVSKDLVSGVVKEDGVAVGEDEQVQEGVKIVLLAAVGVAGEFQEGEVVERHAVCLGDEFVGEGVAAADDDDVAVWEDLVGGIPAAGGEVGAGDFVPVACVAAGAGGEGAELGVAVVEAAGLEESAGGEEGAR
ncbi:hypothetical protein CR513_50177, partial [Mucuna pruriens]